MTFPVITISVRQSNSVSKIQKKRLRDNIILIKTYYARGAIIMLIQDGTIFDVPSYKTNKISQWYIGIQLQF